MGGRETGRYPPHGRRGKTLDAAGEPYAGKPLRGPIRLAECRLDRGRLRNLSEDRKRGEELGKERASRAENRGGNVFCRLAAWMGGRLGGDGGPYIRRRQDLGEPAQRLYRSVFQDLLCR